MEAETTRGHLVFHNVLVCQGSHRAGRLPVAPSAVDAANLSLRAREGETLEIWPETEEKNICFTSCKYTC